jgi:thiol-disulfide isomerase/thioredoxin
MLIFSLPAEAQSGKVPPFRMVQKNGKVFKAEDLPIGKPIIIIYFSPDCKDCQSLTDKVIARINDFKSASIAMITYLSLESVSQFVNKNGLDKYPNIYVGTESNSIFVMNYYNIKDFPFIALYTKNGDLVKRYYDKETDVNDLLHRLNSL